MDPSPLTPHTQTYFKGMISMQNKEYEKALPLFEEAAKGGVLMSAFYAGKISEISGDYTKAHQWYTTAASGRVSKAIYRLGLLYERGNGVEKDEAKALKYYQEGMALFHGKSFAAYEELSKGSKLNPQALYEQALVDCKNTRNLNLKNFKLAAALGHIEAQFELGLIYMHHRSAKVIRYGTSLYSPHKAYQWLLAAAQAGHSRAQLEVADLIYLKKVPDGDQKLALSFYEKMADQGKAIGFCRLGAIYREGKWVNKDMKRAYTLLCKGGSLHEAHHELGLYYQEIGNMEKAHKHLLIADKFTTTFLQPEAWYAINRLELGKFYWEGVYVEKNIEEAKGCFKYASLNHIPEGCYYYGLYHIQYSDEDKGKEEIQWAADHGCALAINKLKEFSNK